VSVEALVSDLTMDAVSWREMEVTVRIELALDTLAGGGAVAVEFALDRGCGALVEAELDLDTETGISSIVLGYSDTLRAIEEAEADERMVAAELAREIEGEGGGPLAWLFEIEETLDTDGD
jgi:hypothetical protein